MFCIGNGCNEGVVAGGPKLSVDKGVGGFAGSVNDGVHEGVLFEFVGFSTIGEGCQVSG